MSNSWQALVSVWPILAARVRSNNSSRSGLEYRIPLAERLDEIKVEEQLKEPVESSLYCLDESQIPISTFFPAFDRSCCFSSSSVDSQIFIAHASSPEEEKRLTFANALLTFAEYLEADHPILTVQITRFSQDTMISITFTHIFGDLFSIKLIMIAWQNLLHGKGPPEKLYNLGVDPFASFASTAEEEEKSKQPPPIPRGFHRFGLIPKVRFIINYLYDIYIQRSEKSIEQRYIFVPKIEGERLEAQAKEDLQVMARRENRRVNDQEYVGKSNTLFAWLMKQSYAASSPSSSSRSKFCTLICIANCRGLQWFAKHHSPHNLFGAALAIPLQSLTIGKLLDLSLGELALHIRKSIKDKVNQADIAENISFSIYQNSWKTRNERKDFVLPAHPNHSHHLSGMSDWRAIKAFDLDFGPAILLLPDDSMPRDKTSRVWSVNVNMTMSSTKRDRWFVLGDSEHGTWLTGFLSSQQWSNLQGFGRYNEL